MQLKEFIQYILKEFHNSNLVAEIGITFDIGIDNNMEINNESSNRVKFSIKNK